MNTIKNNQNLFIVNEQKLSLFLIISFSFIH
jgi:hypothetical protein